MLGPVRARSPRSGLLVALGDARLGTLKLVITLWSSEVRTFPDHFDQLALSPISSSEGRDPTRG